MKKIDHTHELLKSIADAFKTRMHGAQVSSVFVDKETMKSVGFDNVGELSVAQLSAFSDMVEHLMGESAPRVVALNTPIESTSQLAGLHLFCSQLTVSINSTEDSSEINMYEFKGGSIGKTPLCK